MFRWHFPRGMAFAFLLGELIAYDSVGSSATPPLAMQWDECSVLSMKHWRKIVLGSAFNGT